MFDKSLGGPVAFRPVPRLLLRHCFTGALLAGIGLSLNAEIVRQGTEYVVGRMRGDQLRPALAGNSGGIVMVWQDNATDGDGLGVSARLMTPAGVARGERFRVNEVGQGDQENPQIVALSNGSSLVAWQSGPQGSQKIRYRIVGPDGVFRSGDTALEVPGVLDSKHPSLAAMADGTAVISWTAMGFDGDMAGVALQRISATGAPLGSAVQVNQFTASNQRNPSVVAFADGYAVAWVSELQTGANRSDIYLRRFRSNGEAVGSIVRVNSSTDMTSMPTAWSAGNQLWVGWSKIQLSNVSPVLKTIKDRARWVLQYRRFNADLQPLGNEALLSDQVKGDQRNVRFAESGGKAMAVWSTDQFDGSALGVAGRFLSSEGQHEGSAFVVNTISREDQLDPTVVSAGDGRFMVVWSDWRGLDDGMELAVQRFAPDAQPLQALNAPIVSGLSSWQIKAAWAPVQGEGISHYEVHFDGVSVHQTSQAFWESPDVLPGSMHKVRVSYVFPDGRKSPLSPEGEGRSWGKDNNADGLPDDWQATYFGAQTLAWPKPNVDTDKDGVSDLNEFLGGTDPKDPQDNLSVGIRSTEQGPVLEWKTKLGGVYLLQSSSDLESWSDVGGYRFANSASDSLVTPGLPANTYFRVNRIR
jgi:hypothetical protein